MIISRDWDLCVARYLNRDSLKANAIHLCYNCCSSSSYIEMKLEKWLLYLLDEVLDMHFNLVLIPHA